MVDLSDYYEVCVVDLMAHYLYFYSPEHDLGRADFRKGFAALLREKMKYRPIKVKIKPPVNAVVVTKEMSNNCKLWKYLLESLINGTP